MDLTPTLTTSWLGHSLNAFELVHISSVLRSTVPGQLSFQVPITLQSSRRTDPCCCPLLSSAQLFLSSPSLWHVGKQTGFPVFECSVHGSLTKTTPETHLAFYAGPILLCR